MVEDPRAGNRGWRSNPVAQYGVPHGKMAKRRPDLRDNDRNAGLRGGHTGTVEVSLFPVFVAERWHTVPCTRDQG